MDMGRVELALQNTDSFVVSGRVVRASGTVIEAVLPNVSLGTCCDVDAGNGRRVQAEIVAFTESRAVLMPIGDVRGIREGSIVTPTAKSASVSVSNALLGRVVNANLEPIDDGPAITGKKRVPLQQRPPDAMTRRRIGKQLPTGVRAIDTCLVVGEGQRMGIFAGAGVGKSTLMGMLARSTQADVIVVGLVGERGREVREFVERDLGAEGLARSVVVVATGDEPPLVRVRAAHACTAVAEAFRSEGKKVLMLFDSLTRFAMALREVGLAADEPPTSKGYPPSVFTALPQLLERAGNDAGTGSITALYTVLVEGDDLSDPIADAARAALDGHIVLSRKLASAGHFPAIDVLQSVSRVMTDVATVEHRAIANQARDALSAYRESADLIEIGAYVAGTNARVDRALKVLPQLQACLKQDIGERVKPSDALAQMSAALKPR
jgi:flagellum-specific ATP synthase